jgi:P-type Cu2+ transporter
MKEEKEVVELPVSGINDEHCALILEKELGKIEGVKNKKVEFNNHKAVIETSDRNTILKAVNAIRDIGFNVDTIKKEFPVTGMSCASCAVNVQNKLIQDPGVLDASVNYANSRALVEYILGLGSPDHFKTSVQSIGYDLIVGNNKDSADEFEKSQVSYYHALKNRTMLAILFSVPVVIIGMLFPGWFPGRYIMWLLATLVVFFFGRQFFINSLKLARHGSANMDTLVALSTGIAYLFSVFNTIYPQFWENRGLPAHVYFEAASVVISFILLGKMLEEKAKANTSFAIKQLMGLQPAEVIIINFENEERTKKIAEVKVGDHILVHPGDKVAVDGKVISGSSYVDESMISGEPVPVLKEKESLVYSGTINQKGSFVFVATKVGGDTLLAHIIQMVQEAQGSKAPVQKLVDKIAAVFVPSVMGISILTFLIWMIWGGVTGLSYGLLSMVTVLVIACPCALGLATPTAIMAGIGKGAQNGILIKDASSLEVAKKITAVVLDKTGTITEGHPELNHIFWESENFKGQYAPILFSAELQSGHPLASAVIEGMQKEFNQKVKLENFESLTGLGLKVSYQNESFLIGSHELMKANNVSVSSQMMQLSAQWISESQTVIWFAKENSAIAVLSVSDKIKSSSKDAVIAMQKMNLDVIMLTGDNEKTASAIAEKSGIRNFRAELKPDEKASFIKQMQSRGEVVAMAGDGINDSAALALADVSIAMGHGSDIAMDTANITLISSDLAQIPKAIRLSSATSKLIRQNLFWAFIYNIVAIPLAAGILYPTFGFLLNPMIAGAAMALSSVSVVSNSLRLKWIKL